MSVVVSGDDAVFEIPVMMDFDASVPVICDIAMLI